MNAVRHPFANQRSGPGRFGSKIAAFQSAVPVKWCLQCNQHAGDDRGKKGMYCSNCGSKAQHFASTGEFKRYAYLRMLRDAGEITDLHLQVRFPVYFAIVGGQAVMAKSGFKLWRTYIADHAYRDKSGAWVIEEYKGSRKHQDETSKLRREAAEHVYQFTTNVVGV